MLSKKTVAPFVVPTMAETDPEYSGRLARLAALNDALQQLHRDKRSLERELEEMPAPRMSVSVAALLGDEQADARAAKAKELADIKRAIVDHETAISLQTGRVEQAKTAAGRSVCAAVKPEFARRVGVLVEVVTAAIKARAEFKALVDDLEADGVAWRQLGDMTPHFLGDPDDGHAARWLREVKGAGYV